MTLFLNYKNGITSLKTYRNFGTVTDVEDICEHVRDNKRGVLVASISEGDWKIIEDTIGYLKADYVEGE